MDDSIVRGTTSGLDHRDGPGEAGAKVLSGVRRAGNSFPQRLWRDMPTANELIAHGRGWMKIRRIIGADEHLRGSERSDRSRAPRKIRISAV